MNVYRPYPASAKKFRAGGERSENRAEGATKKIPAGPCGKRNAMAGPGGRAGQNRLAARMTVSGTELLHRESWIGPSSLEPVFWSRGPVSNLSPSDLVG